MGKLLNCYIRGLLVAFFIFFSFSSVFATTYYVAPSPIGNNSNSGTSDAPWASIQKAADSMVAGDTVIVEPGTYNENNSKVYSRRSGSVGSPITFKANGSGVITRGFIVSGFNYIIIDGFEVTIPLTVSWNDFDLGVGILLNNASYCQVLNNHIYHTPMMGIETRGTAKFNTINNNKIEYAGFYAGMYISGNNQTVAYNDISHTLQLPLKSIGVGNSGAGEDADGIKFDGKGHLFRGNYIHDITWYDAENNNGADGPHIDGFQVCCAAASNITFDKNFVSFKNPGPSSNSEVYTQGIYFDDYTLYSNITITNNLIQAIQPINLVKVTGGAILHNTLIPSVPTFHPENGVQLISSKNIKVKNNIIYAGIPDSSHTALFMQSCSGIDAGYNNYFHINAAQGGPYLGDKNVDPQFLNYAADDFRLQATSPVKDAGIALPEVFDDRNGVVRPQNGLYDMGAYEYIANQTTDTTPPVPGTAVAPITAGSSPIVVTYSGASDEIGGSGLKEVRLWFKKDSGVWADSGLIQTSSQGAFSFSSMSGNGIYYFALRAQDKAGNYSPTPIGDGNTSTNFSLNQYSITLNIIDKGNIIKSPDKNLYSAGEIVTLTATPMTGYVFAGWSGDVSGVSNSIQVTMDTNKIITATFNIKSYEIVSNAGPNGSISPAGSVSVVHGGTQIFSIRANSGYAVTSVIVDGASVGVVENYTFNNVTSAHTITANFQQADNIPIPDAPVQLTLRRISTTSIKVKWTDHSSYEDGFELQRSTSLSGPFATIARLGSAIGELTTVAYIDSVGLQRGKIYYYRVRAYNSKGSSAWTNIARLKLS